MKQAAVKSRSSAARFKEPCLTVTGQFILCDVPSDFTTCQGTVTMTDATNAQEIIFSVIINMKSANQENMEASHRKPLADQEVLTQFSCCQVIQKPATPPCSTTDTGRCRNTVKL